MQRWTATPTIIAESLVAVPDPLLTTLAPGPPAAGVAVAARLARSLGPPEHQVQPPSWLLRPQCTSFRRVLAAIYRYRGALLADPVGSGKTFVALAVAAQLNRGTTLCLVPASLIAQWQATAARLSVSVTLCSHERVSRGRLPGRGDGCVIVDESHHFRNPRTQRYRHLSTWLVGRPALFLTATPIVNQLSDLAHQLLLAVRDDALRLEGVSSIRALLRGKRSSPALGRLVFQNDAVIDCRPARVCSESKPDPAECELAASRMEMVDQLKVSRCEPLAELLRGVFLRAVASSPAAFRERLGRYRRLLLHARDAASTGRTLDRAELRRFTRELEDQLIWWELLPVAPRDPEIELRDLDLLTGMIDWLDGGPAQPDSKLGRLRDLLADGVPTLVFTAYRATVRYIRDGLPDLRIAWCTGDQAGIGITRVARRSVLGWFRAPQTGSHAPSHLVVTDVAAEGLDLQRVARVVHYDLPWTPMRIEQREGRAVRYGSRHSRVDVVRFVVPPVLERRLGIGAVLSRKGRLPAAAGLGSSGRQIWKWRAELASRFEGVTTAEGVASLVTDELAPGLLAGLSLHASGDPRPLGNSVLWIDQQGSWTDDPEIVERRLQCAAEQQSGEPLDRDRLNQQLPLLARAMRERLSLTRGRRWLLPHAEADVGRVLAVLQTLVAQAARRHDHRRLAELERAIGFVAGGHTAGEAALVRSLARAGEAEFSSRLRKLPAGSPQVEHIEVKLAGLICFSPAKKSPASVASPQCPASRPPSSISTEP